MTVPFYGESGGDLYAAALFELLAVMLAQLRVYLEHPKCQVVSFERLTT